VVSGDARGPYVGVIVPQNEGVTQDYNSRLFDKIAVMLTVHSTFQRSYFLINLYRYSVFVSSTIYVAY